jgi:hypothetical protein
VYTHTHTHTHTHTWGAALDMAPVFKLEKAAASAMGEFCEAKSMPADDMAFNVIHTHTHTHTHTIYIYIYIYV